MTTNCQFFDKQTFDGSTPQSEQDFWQFSQMVCSSTLDSDVDIISTMPNYITKITIPDNQDKVFYFSQTIDIGQVISLAFFIIALGVLIVVGTKSIIYHHL